eukprot:TRINITY_DN3158_c0_g1_i1.p1 TRINITY_DN3158_c0_g1~~TRINITY_DN3158_c0_g1_i1.p1  ORF type:complete len:315 (-),score=70.98 TRINITY_DN3158_c0_g1_i1:86-1030(-)
MADAELPPAKRRRMEPPQGQARYGKPLGEVLNNEITGEIRVYCDGIYDLFHFGHARSLKQARELFPKANVTLVVGVCDDALTMQHKCRTVMTETERADSLRHCKWVDEVVEHAPWIVTQDFLDRHDIDFVVHGEDTPGGVYLGPDGKDVYEFVKLQGRFRLVQRTDGISTTDLIMRIIRDYDLYVRRNLKKGIRRKEMNVSFTKEQRIMLPEKLKQVTANVKGEIKGEISEIKKEFTEKVGELKQVKEKMNTELQGLEAKTHNVLEKWHQGTTNFLQTFVSKFQVLGRKRKRTEEDAGSDSDAQSPRPHHSTEP